MHLIQFATLPCSTSAVISIFWIRCTIGWLGRYYSISNSFVGSSGQSFLYERSVPCKIQVGPRHSTHQEGGIGCSGSIQLPSDYQPGHYFQDAREAGSGSYPTSCTHVKAVQLISVGIQTKALHRDCSAQSRQLAWSPVLRVSSFRWTSRLHSIQSTPTNYCSDWSLISVSAGLHPHGFVPTSRADRVTWPWVTTSPTFGVVILVFLRGVSSDLSSSPPSCPPSPE